MDTLNRLFGATKTCHIRGSNNRCHLVVGELGHRRQQVDPGRTECRAGKVED